MEGLLAGTENMGENHRQAGATDFAGPQSVGTTHSHLTDSAGAAHCEHTVHVWYGSVSSAMTSRSHMMKEKRD